MSRALGTLGAEGRGLDEFLGMKLGLMSQSRSVENVQQGYKSETKGETVGKPFGRDCRSTRVIDAADVK